MRFSRLNPHQHKSLYSPQKSARKLAEYTWQSMFVRETPGLQFHLLILFVSSCSVSSQKKLTSIFYKYFYEHYFPLNVNKKKIPDAPLPWYVAFTESPVSCKISLFNEEYSSKFFLKKNDIVNKSFDLFFLSPSSHRWYLFM